MSPNYTCRFTIPCNEKYKNLAVTNKKSFVPAEQIFSFLRNDFPAGMKMCVMVLRTLLKLKKPKMLFLQRIIKSMECLEIRKEVYDENLNSKNLFG